MLKTDYIDIYQFHNPAFCPRPGDGSGLYEEALKAKEEGKIRHIGITNHRIAVAEEAIRSGLYEDDAVPLLIHFGGAGSEDRGNDAGSRHGIQSP